MIKSKAAEVVISTIPLSPRLPGTDEENYHFNIFSSVVLELPEFFDFGFWNSPLLQSSHSYPALFHASAAMGAIHLAAASGGSAQLSHGRQIQMIRFLLEQFNRSISHISSFPPQAATHTDKTIVLATCLIYVCLGSFQARYEEVIAHIHSGLKLFYAWKPWNTISQFLRGPISADILFILLTRAHTFAQLLHGQSLPSHGIPSVKDMESFLLSGLESPIQTFWQAYAKIELSVNLMVRLLYICDFDSLPGDCTYLEKRKSWSTCFAVWDRRIWDYLEQSPGVILPNAITALQIREAFMAALLAFNPATGELGWDSMEGTFSFIVEKASSILEANGDGPITPSRHLSLTDQDKEKRQAGAKPSGSLHLPSSLATGVSDVLYFVALHCRNEKISRQAIHTLTAYPRIEGIYKSTELGNIAEAGKVFEENTCPRGDPSGTDRCPHRKGEYTCGEHRIITAQLGAVINGQARVVFRTLEDQRLSGPGTEIKIPW
jgi:hypothetical protein